MEQKSVKKQIVFVGFTYDYEHIDIGGLNEIYEVSLIYIPNRVNFFLSKILFNKLMYFKFIDLFVKYKLASISKKRDGVLDLIVTKDNFDYIKSLEKIKSIDKVVIFRNPFKKKFIDHLSDFKVYTFDNSDSQKYHFKHYDQYSPGVSLSKQIQVEIKSDISFVGRNKGREKILLDLKGHLNKFDFDLCIIEDTGIWSKLIGNIFSKVCKTLSYEEYLKKCVKSKVVIDIVQEGQANETMRFIEAMAFKRKLLTNNIDIIKHPLYRKKNVYIFNNVEDINIGEFELFIKEPYDNSISDLIENYSSFHILKNIIEESLEN